MMRMIAEQNTPEGGQIVTSRGESPEVALHGLAQSPRTVASMVVLRALVQGSAAFPWLHLSSFKARNEPKGS
jgi:hypothetical protein